MSDTPPLLREGATAPLEERAADAHDTPAASDDLRETVHELQAHQIELELQNEALGRARRRLEESRDALAASERHYRELFEESPIGELLLDRNGAIVDSNQAAASVLGAEKSQLSGRRLSDFIAARDQDCYYLHRKAAARGESPRPARVVLRPLDGQAREVELRARPTGEHQDQLCAAIVDITGRDRLASERREGERQRRLMADAVPLAASFVGVDGRYEFCNRAFAKLYGRSTDEIERRLIFEVVDAESYAALRDHVRTALAGETTRFEGHLHFPGLGARFVSVLFAPYRSANGEVRGFFQLIDDRSELEAARRSLRKAAAQAALAEERERRSLAADLHDDVGQLVSLLSMKLRELRAQVGKTGSGGRLGELEELTRQIRRRISTLTFELSPPLLYDVGFVPAAEWLRDSLQERYGLRISIEVCGDMPRAGEVPLLDETTRVTLFRALRELLINVARHAGARRARVQISRSGDEVTVAVADDGQGFEPDAIAGGFGLVSVRERVESLGGSLAIESSPRTGSTVTVRVPVLAVSA